MRLSISNVHAIMSFSTDVFNAISTTNLSIKKHYYHSDVQIIRNIVILSICNEVKLAFEAKKIQPFGDTTVILGTDQHLVICAPRTSFEEEFILTEN